MDNEAKRILNNLQRRLDREAIKQLRSEIEVLANKVDKLEKELIYANESADLWHDNAMEMLSAFNEAEEVSNKSIGLTKSGQLLVTSNEQH